MELGLRGKVAMLTGASRGIAKSTAQALAAEGVAVSLCARDLTALERVARDIEAQTRSKALAVQADVTTLSDIQAFTRRTLEELGRIDILVNSVGSSPFGEVLELSDEAWANDMNTKFLGYVRAARLVAPIMIRQGGGVIVNLIGTGGKIANACHAPGGSGNAAVALFTVGFAAEMGRHNVRVVGVSPGPTNTERNLSLAEAMAKRRPGATAQQIRDEWQRQSPLGRLCEPEDVANLIVFLVSDKAHMVNGTVVTIDGGMCKAL